MSKASRDRDSKRREASLERDYIRANNRRNTKQAAKLAAALKRERESRNATQTITRAAGPPAGTPSLDELAKRLELLERRFTEIPGDSTAENLLARPVLLAKKGATGSKTFKEQAIVNGAFVDFEDGRRCNTDSEPFAMIDGQQDVFGLVAYPDGGVTRYAVLPAGIRDIRDNAVLNKIQITYKANPNPDLSAGNTDWVDRIDIDTCNDAGSGVAASVALFGTGAEGFFESPELVVAYTKTVCHSVAVSTADTSTSGANAVLLLHFNSTNGGGLFRLTAQAVGASAQNVMRFFHEPGGSGTFTASSSSGLLGTLTSGNNGTLKHLTKVQFTTTTTLPTGLTAATDYWIVYVSATTFRVATSYANAVAGTVVSYTDAGTGTHTVTPVKLWVPEFDIQLPASTPDNIETPVVGEWVSSDPINGRLFDPDGKLYCAPYEAGSFHVTGHGAQV